MSPFDNVVELNNMITKQFACLMTALSLSSLTALFAIAPAMANPISETASHNEKNASNSTLRQGIPGRRLGGGTRRDRVFADATDNLMALTTVETLSITTAESPKLLFYVPEMVTNNTVEFVLLNDQDNVVFEKTFVLNRDAGIVSIDLANESESESEDESEAIALSLDTNYQWYFSIIPNADDRASDTVVHGSIRRVDRTAWLKQQAADARLGEQLETAEPLAKVRLLYQQANLWQDALALLDELRQADPDNAAIAQEWTQLLASAGLSSPVQ